MHASLAQKEFRDQLALSAGVAEGGGGSVYAVYLCVCHSSVYPFIGHFLIANSVTDTGDRAGNKAGMALSPGDFRLMMEREEAE